MDRACAGRNVQCDYSTVLYVRALFEPVRAVTPSLTYEYSLVRSTSIQSSDRSYEEEEEYEYTTTLYNLVQRSSADDDVTT